MRELGKKISIDRVRAMVFHATFNNISVIFWTKWWSVLLVEDTREHH
jgi:hypothetical protein